MSSWLFRTAHNRAVDVIRKHERRNQVEQEHYEERQEPLAPQPGVEEGRAVSEDVEVALQALESRERALIVLKVFEEKSYKEISAITGLSTGNVGYILHHAMRKLADLLGRSK